MSALDYFKKTALEEATRTIEQMNDGTFENAMGETVEDVYLSENGKFLMIYSDKSSDKKSEDHIETKNKVIKAFKEFHAND